MAGGWNFAGTPSTGGLTGPTLTLVEGESFCISDAGGDIVPGTAQGLFDRDTRFLSGWRLLVDDVPPEHLAVLPGTPFAAAVLGLGRPVGGRTDSTLLVFRHRYVGRGMREDLVLRNAALEPAAATLTLHVDADFAHLFEVKEERVVPRGERTVTTDGGALRYDYTWRGIRRGVIVEVGGAEATAHDDGVLSIEAVVPARGEWSCCVQVTPVMDEGPVAPQYRCDQALDTTIPAHRLRQWRRGVPRVTSGHEGLSKALAAAEEDLGALRIFDPEHPDRAVVAAGAPWFMTLFGRDSLITSWMALLVDPSLAVGTLRTLARYQGTEEDPLSEQEPGRIPHELRWGLTHSLARGAGSLYYGSADATPLFVMLMGELRRWGVEREVVDELLPHADRALAWITDYGDRDGDGFVEYRRATDRGLLHQGWKDSVDAISFATGRPADPPIALAEVQGYVYSAYLARAHFAREAHDDDAYHHWVGKATSLKSSFNEAFWLPDRGYFAVGLDRDKAPIDSLTSNIGHCLWTGIVDEDKAALVVERLMAADMFTGFGVRTLSSDMGAYNPVSYHNGSVWPHDSAITAAGLMRYGYADQANRITLGLLDAADSLGGRLPELFCGFDRKEFATPIRYPTACSPQAWAAATPYLLVRTMLRFDPWIPRLALWLAPSLPSEVGGLSVVNVPLAGTRIELDASDGAATVAGLPRDIKLVTEPRHPLTEAT